MKFVDSSDHGRNEEIRSSTYTNLRRFQLSDEELLLELLPFVEGLFCPDEDNFMPLMVLLEISMKGKETPLLIAVPNADDKRIFGFTIGVAMKQFRTDRVGLVTEAWTLPEDVPLPPGVAISEHPMRSECFNLALFNRRMGTMGVMWPVESASGQRTLKDPIFTFDRFETRLDQDIEEAWKWFGEEKHAQTAIDTAMRGYRGPRVQTCIRNPIHGSHFGIDYHVLPEEGVASRIPHSGFGSLPRMSRFRA